MTDATGDATAATDTVAEPDFPSLVAVIVALPGPVAVTTPSTETLATAELLELHVTVRPERGFPAASYSPAVAEALPPTAKFAVERETTTEETGATDFGVTTNVAPLLFPSLVATIVAVPGPAPVTAPVGDILATVVSLDLQETARSVRMLPAPSSTIAVAAAGAPTTIVFADNCTITEATGTLNGPTLSDADPDTPPLVATTLAVPGPTAFTIPSAVIDTTFGLVVAQVTLRPLRMLPAGSRNTTVACTELPIVTDVDGKVTVTEATETGTGGMTEIDAVALSPSLVAVMTAVPGMTPTMVPVDASIRATVGALDDQTMASGMITVASAARSVARARAVLPTVMAALSNSMEIVAAAGGAPVSTDSDPAQDSRVANATTRNNDFTTINLARPLERTTGGAGWCAADEL